MIKAIVFDKDGTVLDYGKFWIPVAEAAAKELISKKASDISASALLDSIGAHDGIRGILCYGTYADIAEAFNKADPNAGFTASEVASAFESAVSSGEIAPTCDDIVSLMTELKERGYIIAMVTSDNEKMAKYCLEKLGIHEFFDKVMADDGVHPSKPHPYHMQTLCREFSLLPTEVLMIGDTMTDIKFAKNSGTHFMGVAKDESDARLIQVDAEYLASDISHTLDIIERIDNTNE